MVCKDSECSAVFDLCKVMEMADAGLMFNCTNSGSLNMLSISLPKEERPTSQRITYSLFTLVTGCVLNKYINTLPNVVWMSFHSVTHYLIQQGL